MKFIKALSLTLMFNGLALAQSQNGINEAWKGFSDPEIFSSGFIHNMSALPLEGSIQGGTKAWSGDYWASNKGSINIRWNTPQRDGFNLKSPSKAQVMSMSLEQLATLAPTEKYDLFIGNYDYPLKREASGTANRMAQDWAGICHGWAPASLFHNEPTPKVMTNPDGIQIPFGSSDIKALISYFYAYHHDVGSNQMGLRCFFGSWLGGARGCSEDLNAGAFHIVIGNKLGLQREGFLMDAERFREVWNQPVTGYKTVVVASNLSPSFGSASSTVREMRIRTDLFYVSESDPTWDIVHGTDSQVIEKLELQYRIELNAEGKIVGGEWESSVRPDFLWNKRPATAEEFTGIMSALPQLLND